MSKRKFQVTTDEDEDDDNINNGELGGVSMFRKYQKSSNNQATSKQPTSCEIPTNISSKISNVEGNVPKPKGVPSKESNIQQPTSSVKLNPSVGKSFAETFSFLKKSDMYELPPEPKVPEKVIPKNTNSIIVNSRQRGNPILKSIRNIPWEFGEIIPDYEVGQTSCVLFLSLRYHNLNPDYIHERLKQLGNRYVLRVILVQVDVEKRTSQDVDVKNEKNTRHSLKELGKIAILSNCTLILAWRRNQLLSLLVRMTSVIINGCLISATELAEIKQSLVNHTQKCYLKTLTSNVSPEEAGRYLETYKSYEHKPPDVLQERIEPDYLSKAQDFLTTIKSINKTDVITLLSNFKSIKGIVNASVEEFSLCPGLGPQKANRLFKAFNEPFKRTRTTSSTSMETNNFTSSQLRRPVDKSETKTQTKIIKPVDSSPKKPKKVKTKDPETTTSSKKVVQSEVLMNIDTSPQKNNETVKPKSLSKSDAVYKSGLSRNKRDKSQITKPEVTKTITNVENSNKSNSSEEELILIRRPQIQKSEHSEKREKHSLSGDIPQINKVREAESCDVILEPDDINPVNTRRRFNVDSTSGDVDSTLKGRHLLTGKETTKDISKKKLTLQKYINTNVKSHTSKEPSTLLPSTTNTELTQEEYDDIVASSDDDEEEEEEY